jgi:hypothetical protein
MATTMTFHESYGSLPTKTLRLVKKHNVSPTDFDFMLDQFSGTVDEGWAWVNDHIVSNSEAGSYRPRYF